MALTSGTQFGAYEIVGALGAGGMGEVYRARDRKLGREVALKILPDTFALDIERLARFKREAQVLASLNHPNIAGIYHVEDANGRSALVLELVEGDTLADRLSAGRLPLDEALPVARQIAEALDAAHEQGIVHRDLKPANIKVRADGTVKVLDFGLAKLVEPEAGSYVQTDFGVRSTPPNATQSPTITSPALMTGMGVLLGTAAYMSPEQTKGKSADKRSDIWAFGCVLFEMLAGKRAFEGDDVADTLANILKAQPDWSALPQDTPSQMQRLVGRCLAKDRRERLRDIGDVHLELKELATAPDAARPAGASVRGRHARLAWVVAAAATIVAGITMMRSVLTPPAAPTTIEFTVTPPSNGRLSGMPGGGTGVAPQLAVSPDGGKIAFVVASAKGDFTLWVRSLDALDARELPGTDQAAFPFWSPDSRFIGFFAAGKLKKIPLDGGSAVTLCDSVGGRGGTWNRNDVIVFAPGASGLLRVPGVGGAPAPVTTLDRSHGEAGHRWPHFLPDGRHFLFTTVEGPAGSAPGPSQVKLGSLDSNETVTLFAAESAVSYSSGHLFFWRDGDLLAQSFDAGARRITGDPFPVARRVVAEGLRYVAASVSPTGVLVYAARSEDSSTQLTWKDRAGRVLGTVAEPGQYAHLALAPDDRRVAVSLPTNAKTAIPGAATDVWVINLERSTSTRITFAPGNNAFPVWSPGGDQIAFFSSRERKAGIYRIAADGAGRDEFLYGPVAGLGPSDWSPDGQLIAFNQAGAATGVDIWLLPLTNRKPSVFTNAPNSQSEAVFSPDGRWIAYATVDQAFGQQVFVQPYPATGAQHQVSRNGGSQPRWRGDGRELFFLTPDGQMMAVAIDTRHGFDAANPALLFQAGTNPGIGGRRYDVTRDGQRFLINMPVGGSAPASLTVVTNWQASTRK